MATPYGYCKCGCGQRTHIATHTRLDHVRGEPLPYLRNHRKRRPFSYTVQDCGYGSPCWTFDGALNSDGYGQVWRDGRRWSAHRFAYLQAHGGIPAGTEIDHLCRNRACVNPAHLEAVTHAENVRRGAIPKLGPSGVMAVVMLRLTTTLSLNDIGEIVGVRAQSVQKVLEGRSYRGLLPLGRRPLA